MARKSGNGSGPEKSGPMYLKRLSSHEKDEINASGSGELVDESFSREAVENALNERAKEWKVSFEIVQSSIFYEEFGRLLGFYRTDDNDRKRSRPLSYEIGMAEEAMQFIEETRIRLRHLPPHVEAQVSNACWSRRKEWFQSFRARLDADLHEAWSMLCLAERSLEPHVGKAGARGKWHRDRFLYDVAQLLSTHGVKLKGDQANFAGAALLAVGVECPSDPNECQKLIAAIARTVGE